MIIRKAAAFAVVPDVADSLIINQNPAFGLRKNPFYLCQRDMVERGKHHPLFEMVFPDDLLDLVSGICHSPLI